jgi:hypothetical protein
MVRCVCVCVCVYQLEKLVGWGGNIIVMCESLQYSALYFIAVYTITSHLLCLRQNAIWKKAPSVHVNLLNPHVRSHNA